MLRLGLFIGIFAVMALAEAALEGFSEQEAHQLEAFLRRIIHNVGRTEETPSGQEPRE